MRISTSTELGRLLAAARQQRELTQAQLAAAIGVSRFWVIRAERGEPGVETGLVLRALRYLQVTVDLTPRPVPPT